MDFLDRESTPLVKRILSFFKEKTNTMRGEDLFIRIYMYRRLLCGN